jgi:hypothetical protein
MAMRIYATKYSFIYLKKFILFLYSASINWFGCTVLNHLHSNVALIRFLVSSVWVVWLKMISPFGLINESKTDFDGVL